MTDPGPDLLAKLFSACGSILGSSLMLHYIKPVSLKDGLMRLLVALITTFTLSVALLTFANVGFSYEMHLGIGFIIGLFSWACISVIVRTIHNIEYKKEDLFDIINKVRKKDK